MAIILYSNGIVEEYKSNDLVFTDEEILHVFDGFKRIRSRRLIEIPNVWCLWGESEVKQDNEYSTIGSNLMEDHIFSIVVFIHDTELDPSWRLSESVIYGDYPLFKEGMMGLIDHVAKLTIKESQEKRRLEGNDDNIVYLDTKGSTDDKKVLFELDPKKQSLNFYKEQNFKNFAYKVSEYLKDHHYESGIMFYIYEDNKMIMYIRNRDVEEILTKIIQFYEKKEKYERCKIVTDALEKWRDFKPHQRRKNKNKK